MIDLAVEVNGHSIRPKGLEGVVEAAVISGVRDTIHRQVASKRCHVHGEPAHITLTGIGPERLSFRVSGCCQPFIDTVTRSLNPDHQEVG